MKFMQGSLANVELLRNQPIEDICSSQEVTNFHRRSLGHMVPPEIDGLKK